MVDIFLLILMELRAPATASCWVQKTENSTKIFLKMQYTFKFYFDAALIILSLVEQFYPATFPSCLCTEIIFTVLISQHLFAVIKIYTVIIQSFIYRRFYLLITLITEGSQIKLPSIEIALGYHVNPLPHPLSDSTSTKNKCLA